MMNEVGTSSAHELLERLRNVPGFIAGCIVQREDLKFIGRLDSPAVVLEDVVSRIIRSTCGLRASPASTPQPVRELLATAGQFHILCRSAMYTESLSLIMILDRFTANTAVARFEMAEAMALL